MVETMGREASASPTRLEGMEISEVAQYISN